MFKDNSYGASALRDVRGAEILLKSGDYNLSVEHSQQAIEKILKEYLVSKNYLSSTSDMLKSHKLLRLSSACNIDKLKVYNDVLSTITDCYFDARYPGIDFELYTFEQAEKYFEVAKDIISIVTKDLLSSVNKLKLD